MDSEFADKVVLVTGATSGIGRACALRFAGAGARIAAVGRNEEALANLSQEVGEAERQDSFVASRFVAGTRSGTGG